MGSRQRSGRVEKQRGDESTDKGWKQKGGDWNVRRLVEITTVIVFDSVFNYAGLVFVYLPRSCEGTRKEMKERERERRREDWEQGGNTRWRHKKKKKSFSLFSGMIETQRGHCGRKRGGIKETTNQRPAAAASRSLSDSSKRWPASCRAAAPWQVVMEKQIGAKAARWWAGRRKSKA